MRRVSKLRQVLPIVGTSAGILLPFLTYVWLHLQIVATGYRIEATEERIRLAEQHNRALRLERARLSSLDRIEERARQLGMEPVPLGRLLVVGAREAP